MWAVVSSSRLDAPFWRASDKQRSDQELDTGLDSGGSVGPAEAASLSVQIVTVPITVLVTVRAGSLSVPVGSARSTCPSESGRAGCSLQLKREYECEAAAARLRGVRVAPPAGACPESRIGQSLSCINSTRCLPE